nr:hypothetical protein [Rubrobacter tropicus]
MVTDDDLGRRLDLAHPVEGLPGLLEGHLHLHDDHVGLLLAGEVDGAIVVGGLADDLEPPVGGQELRQPLAEHGVVVRQ